MLTSETDADAEGLALAAGAADFIRKPVNPEVLLSRVRNSLSREKAATV
jgi:DNA-binding response OmpR family regulator